MLTHDQALELALRAVREAPKHPVENPSEDTTIFTSSWSGANSELDSLDVAQVMMYVENELESQYGIRADIMPGELMTIKALVARIMEYR
jgi:hypothetical protein